MAAFGGLVMAGSWRRVVLVVLDGVGAGALPDAELYGDAGACTLQHIGEAVGGLRLPNLQRLGLGNILSLPGVPPAPRPTAAFGRMQEMSAGKDTIVGHWELSGVITDHSFATFPAGFPAEIIHAFQTATGLATLGNIVASGTAILQQLGEEHLRSGSPIVYTSADSVFQIAAHEEVIAPENLYELCRIARELLTPWQVLRVIARPFTGTCAADFRRTANRHDFSQPPTGPTVLDLLQSAGLDVIGIGKIHDIFAGRGLTRTCFTSGNAAGMKSTVEAFAALHRGLVFTNLVDFDMLFGHRQDAEGFSRALTEFDVWLPSMMQMMGNGDLLIITADHGCDPTTPGTDHTREYVPLLAWSPQMRRGIDLKIRVSFADVGATIAEAFSLAAPAGRSFLSSLKGRGEVTAAAAR